MGTRVVRALFSAHVTPSIQLHEGDLWLADDALVLAHPDWFSDDLGSIANGTSTTRVAEPAVVVEDASAEPGAKRTTGTPRRSA